MKEIDLSALDDLEGGLLISPVVARSVAQDSFESDDADTEGRNSSYFLFSKAVGRENLYFELLRLDRPLTYRTLFRQKPELIT